MSSCMNPIGCSAIHELKTNVSEMNNKLTGVFALLQLFFDSWKHAENTKVGIDQQSASQSDVNCTVPIVTQKENLQEQEHVQLFIPQTESSSSVANADATIKQEIGNFPDDYEPEILETDIKETNYEQTVAQEQQFSFSEFGVESTVNNKKRKIDDVENDLMQNEEQPSTSGGQINDWTLEQQVNGDGCSPLTTNELQRSDLLPQSAAVPVLAGPPAAVEAKEPDLVRFFTSQNGLKAVRIRHCRHSRGPAIRNKLVQEFELETTGVQQLTVGPCSVPLDVYNKAVTETAEKNKKPSVFALKLLDNIFSPCELAQGRVFGGKRTSGKQWEQLDPEKLNALFGLMQTLFPESFSLQSALSPNGTIRNSTAIGKQTTAVLTAINTKCRDYTMLVDNAEIEHELEANFDIKLINLEDNRYAIKYVLTVQNGVSEIVAVKQK